MQHLHEVESAAKQVTSGCVP